MELVIEKADGTPFSKEDWINFSNCIMNRNLSREDEKEFWNKYGKAVHDVEIIVDQDSSNVYAIALFPGVSKDRIAVSIEGRDLNIDAKPVEENDTDKPLLWKCLDNLAFSGHVKLPGEVIAEEATAECVNGILYVLMPKPETVKPKMITVK